MADDERKSGAKGINSDDVVYSPPLEENKQKQTKSKPTFFSHWRRHDKEILVRFVSIISERLILFHFSQKMKHKGKRRNEKVRL